MNKYNKNYLKVIILFFIFYYGTCNNKSHNNTPICKSLKKLRDNNNNYALFKKKLIYYSCKHKDGNKTRRVYSVLAKDILRKYVYIINVVVIYIILYNL